MTRTTVEVVTLLLAAPAGDPLWAARIGELAGLGRSTVSQIPVRLTALGWVTPRVEEGPHPGRPARVLCELTPEGRNQTEVVLAARQAHRQPADRHDNQPDPDPAPARPALRWAGHLPIRIPDLETLRRSVAANTLKEALASLSAVNESLDEDVLARALADPEHEDIVRAVIAQTAGRWPAATSSACGSIDHLPEAAART